jgi:uncharacterized protein
MESKLLKQMLYILMIISFLSGCYKNVSQTKQVTVKGDAIVYTTPDKIILNVGVCSEDPDLLTAREANQEIIGQVFSVLEKAGIEEKDIHTSNISINLQYSNYPERELQGYEVSHNIAVVTYDVLLVDELLTDLLLAGVNRLQGISFESTNIQEYRSKARQLALEAARNKANEMAGVYNKSIGEPITITEIPETRTFLPQQQNALLEVSSSLNVEPIRTIALGQIPITASVSVIFDLIQ